MRARIKTKPSTIVRYWKSNRCDPSGWEPASFDPDMDVPACMICGFSFAVLNQIIGEVGRESDYDWNTASLDRSHLHSHALGGSDEPSNLIMACRRCNRSMMPQFRSRDSALRHLAQASWASRAFAANAWLYAMWKSDKANDAFEIFRSLKDDFIESANADETEAKP